MPAYLRKGFPIPKWITFSKILIQDGWTVKLFRSKSTYSKYLYVSKNGFKYKVRFSNHKANRFQESKKDSDFYVGVGNSGVLTTEELLKKLIKC